MGDNNYSFILKDRYLVGEILGRGAFGITYSGFDNNLRIKVAIKEYFPEGYAEKTADGKVRIYDEGAEEIFDLEKKSFLEEARILAKLGDLPGVVRVFDYFEDNNTCYEIMEYLEGRTLSEYLCTEGGKLPADRALRMMEPVLRSLVRIHKEGVIHKDISPDNIMITNNGRVKLIDFGAADRKGDKGLNDLKVYKESYSPIEQIEGRGVSESADVYAFCATMYAALTGRKPTSAAKRAKGDGLKSLTECGVTIDPLREHALMQGMAVDPDMRTQNAEELYYFLYMYGNKIADNDNDPMKDGIRKDKTDELLEKVKVRSGERKYKAWTKWAIIGGAVFITLMIIISTAVRSRMKQDINPAVNTTESVSVNSSVNSAENPQSPTVITEEKKDLSELKEGFINEITGRNAGCTSSDELERAAVLCGEYISDSKYDSYDDMAAIYDEATKYAYDNTGITASWLIIPVGQSENLKDRFSQALSAEANRQNFDSMTEYGTAVIRDNLGMVFYIIFMR